MQVGRQVGSARLVAMAAMTMMTNHQSVEEVDLETVMGMLIEGRVVPEGHLEEAMSGVDRQEVTMTKMMNEALEGAVEVQLDVEDVETGIMTRTTTSARSSSR